MSGRINDYRDEPTYSREGDFVTVINHLYILTYVRDYIFLARNYTILALSKIPKLNKNKNGSIIVQSNI